MLGMGERHVMLLTLTIETIPKNGPDKSFADFANLLDTIYKAPSKDGVTGDTAQSTDADDLGDTDSDDSYEPSPKGTVLALSDMGDEDGIMTLLVNLSDKSAPDPVFLNVETQKTRPAKKRNGEGLGHSAHLCILKPTKPTKDFTCFAVLEKAPFLSKGIILSYINRQLRAACTGNGAFTFIDEKGRSRPYRLRLGAEAKPSQKLKADLEKGALSTVELRAKKVEQEFDEKDMIITKAKRISFKVDQRASDYKQVLAKIIKWGKANKYEEVSLKFKKTKSREARMSAVLNIHSSR